MFNGYKMLFLALKKVQIANITFHQIPTTELKVSFVAKFLIALNFCIPRKNLNFPFAPREDFWKKMTKVKIPMSTYFVPLCLKNPYSIS